MGNVTHPTAIRNGIADHVVDQLNTGTIEFLTAADAVIATLTFASTAFGAGGTPSAGIATAEEIGSDTDCEPGTVTKFVAKSSGSAVIFQGTVTATGGGGDITLSSTLIGDGDTISISALTYEAPD